MNIQGILTSKFRQEKKEYTTVKKKKKKTRQTILRDDLLKCMSCSKESIAKPNYRAKSH